MATVNASVPKIEDSTRAGVTHLSEVGETIRDDALKVAKASMGGLDRGLETEDLFKNPRFVDRFNYGLAKGASLSIAANDQRVNEIHLFESETDADLEAGCDLPIDVSVHLLATISAPSAALESFIESLDRALIESLRELPTDLYSEKKWLLDVKLITEEDIAHGTGYACLLNSIHTPTLKIWER